MKHVEQVVRALINAKAFHATKYLNDRMVVRATHRRVRGKVPNRAGSYDIVLTIGRPNYVERKFIADCKKAGVTFPVRKVQLKAAPKPRRQRREVGWKRTRAQCS